MTFQTIERGEGGVDGFLAGLQRELRENAYRASPLRRKYIEKASAQDAVARIAETAKKGGALVYDAGLSSYFDTILHDKLMAAMQMRISDGSTN